MTKLSKQLNIAYFWYECVLDWEYFISNELDNEWIMVESQFDNADDSNDFFMVW